MDSITDAFNNFEEATRRARYRARADASGRRLEGALRKAFRAQGSQFVRGLRAKAKDHFDKPLQPVATNTNSEATNPWEAYAERLTQAFNEAISATDWQQIWAEVQLNTVHLFSAPLEKYVLEALQHGGLAQIADLGMNIKFDLENPRAVKYLQDYGAKMVAGLNLETQSQLQTLLAQAADEGWSYDKTAQAITDKFDGFADGRPQDHIDSRAHGIAVTEIGDAYSEGNLEVAQQLSDAGLDMEKFWSTVNDDKVNQEICGANQEQGWIPLEDPFQSGHDRPLGHPYCRCDLLTRVASATQAAETGDGSLKLPHPKGSE